MTGKRTSRLSDAIIEAICERLVEGESLRKICADPAMPDRKTVYRALREDDDFVRLYGLARDFQADALFEEILQIADTPLEGVKTKILPDGGVEESKGDMIEHRRLQVDARKWMVSKLAPKKYGDKLALTDADGGPLTVNVVQRMPRPTADREGTSARSNIPPPTLRRRHMPPPARQA